MEYQFRHDPITGVATAKFSIDHEVIGHWLETELGKDEQKLTEILTAIDLVAHRKQQEIMLEGHEFSALLTPDEVTIQSNQSINAEEDAELQAQELHDCDDINFAECGLDDFREVILSWAKFIK
jgi:hypothetical protein